MFCLCRVWKSSASTIVVYLWACFLWSSCARGFGFRWGGFEWALPQQQLVVCSGDFLCFCLMERSTHLKKIKSLRMIILSFIPFLHLWYAHQHCLAVSRQLCQVYRSEVQHLQENQESDWQQHFYIEYYVMAPSYLNDKITTQVLI